jgi:hypothetical protein
MMKRIFALGLLVAVFQSLIAQTSPHGTIKFECGTCHGTDSWKMLSDAQFFHASTGFDLTGAHKKLDCRLCHEGLKFTGAKADCQACHIDVHKGELGQNCLRCHTTQVWKITDMIQRHQQTRFPLLSQHATAQCEACHAQNANQQYSGTPTTCIGCHRKDYQSSQIPNHTMAGFSTDCSQCHYVNSPSWRGGFDHQITSFPLTGAHRTVQCSLCHTTNVFKSTPHDCYSCHLTNYNNVQNPSHIAGNFSHACETCHTTNLWSPASFDHSTTKFTLTGTHITTPCGSCHVNNNYQISYTNCYMCHQADFQKPTNPNHVAGNFAHTCDQCHTTTVWTPSTFNHANTLFPLVGAHIAVPCGNCHVNNVYAGLHQNCIDCHQTDFNNAANPNHVAGNFSTTCTTCHSMNAWSPATFDHSNTKFALTGAHTSVQCQTCHSNGNYQLVYTNCYQCHAADFTGAITPVPHTGFPTNCSSCHTTNPGWTPSTFVHVNTVPRFPTDNRHQSAACMKCHQTPANYTIICCLSSGCHNTCTGGGN